MKTEIQPLIKLNENRIIRWESHSPGKKVYIRYKEVDEIINYSIGTVAAIEIKASLSKSSIKSGIDQLKESQFLLSKAFKNVFSILILADCRSIDSDFGYTESSMRDLLLAENEFQICSAIDILKTPLIDTKICIIFDESQVQKLVTKYGNPYDFDDLLQS